MCSVLLLFNDIFCSLLHCYKALSTLYIRLWISRASIAVRAPTQASELPHKSLQTPLWLACSPALALPRCTENTYSHTVVVPVTTPGTQSQRCESSFYPLFLPCLLFPLFSSSLHSTYTVFTVSSLKEPGEISHPPRESRKISEPLLAVPRVWRQLSRIEASNA